MSSTIIHKEQMTAFERWELASFNAPSEADSQSESKTQDSLPSVAEVENIRTQAYQEAYQEGYATGIQQASNEATTINQLLQSLQEELNHLDEDVSRSLLDLSLEVAKKMVHETIQVKPEVILEIVSAAISSLPLINQNAHLILHPDDAEILRLHMGLQLSHAGWKIFTDAEILRGGCRVETSHTHIDATLEARWKSILRRMGQDKSWLA